VTALRVRVAEAIAAPFVIGALAVALFVVWAEADAGFASTTWYPGGLFLLALLVVALVVYGRLALSRPSLIAAGCLLAYAAWSGLSISWASDQGIAWDGANRTLVYALVYTLFAALPWRRPSVPVLLCGFSLGVLVIGLVDLARAGSGSTSEFFIHGRLSAPAGYSNAACALYMLAFWPLAYVAARRELPAAVRGALLAAATALLELAVLTQSRGSLFAVPVAVVAYLLIVPKRFRAASALAVAGVTAVLARGDLLDVFDPVRSGVGSSAAIHTALGAIGISAAAVSVLWTAIAVLDARIEAPPRIVRATNVAAIALTVVALVAGAAVIATADPGPRERLSDAWRHFKAGYPEQTTSSHFSLGLGSNRYDFWRVAMQEFRDHPVRGVGVDNFAEDYLVERRSSEEPLYPHSLELRVLGQTGVVGAILFCAFVVAAGLAVLRGAGALSDLSSGAARAGVAAAVYFAIHASGDWFWEFPGLTAPALAWLGLGAARKPAAIPSATKRRLLLGVASVAALAAAVSMTFPWLAEVDAQRATRIWAEQPARAFDNLDRSRRLNPLSGRADILAGAIASRLDLLPRMRLAFSRAVARDARNWYSHFELGIAEAGLGHRTAALRELATAARLNPDETAIGTVRRLVRLRRPIDREGIDSLFVERVQTRVGP
jgi:O-antigen ligase/polysaccharide polymerase Wzy-like membrane protein